MRITLALVILILTSCSPNQPEQTAETQQKTRSPWYYRTFDDSMRNERTWIATTESTNPAQLGFPYEGGTTATIKLSQSQNEDPTNEQAILILHNGQIDCASRCYLSLKFDNGQVLNSSGTREDCGEDQCINLPVNEDMDRFGTKEYQGFHKRLMSSRRLIVEVPIYKYGYHQFQFITAGLVWPQPSAPKRGEGTGVADGSKKM